MSKLNAKLKQIIDDSSTIDTKHSNSTKHLIPRHKNCLSLSSLPQSKEQIISEIRNKIDTFKQIKNTNQQEDLLNFDVSREGLQNYYTHSRKTIEEKTIVPKSNSKPNILIENDNQFFGIDVKNMFKTTKRNEKQKSFEKPIKLKTMSQTTTNRKYIQIKGLKEKENSHYTEENPNNNKIKTQINLFVKQLNYNDVTSSPLQTNGNYNITFNNNSNQFSTHSQNGIDMNDVRNLKSSLISLSREDLKLLPSENKKELKELADIINMLIN